MVAIKTVNYKGISTAKASMVQSVTRSSRTRPPKQQLNRFSVLKACGVM